MRENVLMSARFEHHARTVTLLTLVSRITGLARDASLARIFGNGALMDAFNFAFMIPNLFRRLFGEGALSAAFLPAYADLDKNNPGVARQLATLTIGLMLAVLGALTIVGEIVLWLVLASDASHDMLAVRLTMVMLPYMPLVCMVAIMGAMLQVHGRFGPAAAAPVVLNLCIVAATLGGAKLLKNGQAADRSHISIVAASVLLAGVLQVIWALWSLRGTKWLVGGFAKCREAREPFRKMLGQAWPMFIGLGVLQINTFIDGLVASYPTTFGPTIFGIDYPLEPGALASLSNAARLYEFPLGVFGIAVATAIFPALSKLKDDAHAFSDTLRRGLRLVVYIGLPASVGLILVRHQLVAVMFQGGDFTASDTRRVAFVLMGYAPAIWAYSMTHVLTRAFYAKGNSMTPVKVAVGMVALNFAMNITLIWTPLREAGLAWSTAVSAIIQSIILLRLARRKYADHAIVDRDVRASWVRSAIATVVMGAAVWATAQFALFNWWSAETGDLRWRDLAMQLAILVSVGGAAYAAASLALRMPELWWAMGRTAK